MINVKLDKTGGLTEALRLVAAARAARPRGDGRLHGRRPRSASRRRCCSPAVADVVDLDGPLWLAHDRGPALRFADGCVYPPEPALWG